MDANTQESENQNSLFSKQFVTRNGLINTHLEFSNKDALSSSWLMDATQELEDQYTPSLFSKRFASRDELIKNHIDFATTESENNRLKHDCHLNIAYGKTTREKLDIYGDNLSAKSPIFVYIHGGYWQMLDKWKSAYYAAPLIAKGIRVIVVGYELCPIVTLEEQVEQIQKSFKWISEYVATNSIKSVSFAGHSAGAHLIACALKKDFINTVAKDVKLFVYYLSGVFDLHELRHLKAANENNILSLSEENVRRLSPQFHDFRHLLDRQIKNFIFAGEFESEKFRQMSKEFAEGPLKHLCSVNFKVLCSVDHFNIVENLAESNYELTKLIVKNSTNSGE